MSILGSRYRLDERIGTGGMAVVWRGYDLVLERTIAVKMLDSSVAADPRACAYARREALAAARLTHPNVAAVYDFGEVRRGLRAGQPYIVMEFVDGETLQQRLRREGALHWRAAASIGAQVAAALTAAHERGMVHRDVKPGNVMLTATGVKVVDFGIAAAIGQAQTNTAGIVFGTPLYMAPEQLRGDPVLPASDIYALGLVLYECLTGHSPWPDGSPADIALARGEHLLPAPLPAIDGLPDAVAELCRGCLDEVPGKRPTGLRAARVLVEPANTEPASPKPALAYAEPISATAPQRPPAPASRWTTGVLTATTVSGRPSPRPAGRHGEEHPAAPRQTRGAARSRPVTVAVAAAAATVATLTATYLAGGSLPGSAAVSQAESQGDGSLAGCATHYAVRERHDGSFTASLTVTNTGGGALEGWSLTFALPTGQRLTSADGARWSATGTQVTLHGDELLAAGRAAKVFLVGRFVDGGGTPTGFALDGVRCQQVSAVVHTAGASGRTAPGATGAPSRRAGGPEFDLPRPAVTSATPTPAPPVAPTPSASAAPSPSLDPSASANPSSASPTPSGPQPWPGSQAPFSATPTASTSPGPDQ